MEESAEFWVDICGVSDIPVRGARILKSDSVSIAVFRTVDNQVFALEDKCPHLGGPLSQGIVHGTSVTCPLHNLVISLETGKAVSEEGCTHSFPVKVDGTRVLISLPKSIRGDDG